MRFHILPALYRRKVLLRLFRPRHRGIHPRVALNAHAFLLLLFPSRVALAGLRFRVRICGGCTPPLHPCGCFRSVPASVICL